MTNFFARVSNITGSPFPPVGVVRAGELAACIPKAGASQVRSRGPHKAGDALWWPQVWQGRQARFV